MLWNGTKVPIFIKVDLEDRSRWNIVCNIAADLVADSTQMDQSMRKFAAKQLRRTCQSTEQHCASHYRGRVCQTPDHRRDSVTNDGHFAVYYDDGGLFPKNIIK